MAGTGAEVISASAPFNPDLLGYTWRVWRDELAISGWCATRKQADQNVKRAKRLLEGRPVTASVWGNRKQRAHQLASLYEDDDHDQ